MPADIVERVLEKILQTQITEYADIQYRFNNLDTKAQNTVAIAGIFIVASLAFLPIKDLPDMINLLGKEAVVIMGYVLALLVAAVMCCLKAMRIRWTPTPSFVKYGSDLLGLSHDEISNEIYQNYLRDLARSLQKSTKGVHLHVNAKAQWILMGQILLGGAMISVSTLLSLILRAGYFIY